MTVLREEVEPRVAVLRHGGGVRVCGVVEGAGETEVGDAVAEAAAVAGRLLRDDIDDPADSRCSEQGATATAHHLNSIDHLRRNLLKTVNAIQ